MGVILGKDGFIFDCRYSTEQNKIGVLESFKSLLRGDIYNVDIICGLSINGSLLIPAYLNLGKLFTPLTYYGTADESLDVSVNRFIRSNKPSFSVVGSFAVIGVFHLKFDAETKEIIRDKSMIDFYVPKKFYDTSEAIKKAGVSSPVLVCDKLSTSNGIHTYKVDENTYKGYVESSIKNLSMDILGSREQFILNRTKVDK